MKQNKKSIKCVAGGKENKLVDETNIKQEQKQASEKVEDRGEVILTQIGYERQRSYARPGNC